MRGLPLCVALVVTVAFAGCSNSQDTTPDEGLGSADSTVARPSQLLLLNCHGGTSRIVVPASTVSPDSPQGWETETEVVAIVIDAMTCEHLSLGPFERGPIQVVLESHSKFDAPEACRIGDYDQLNALQSVWVDDADVADYLQSVLGMPAISATITRTTDGIPELLTATWAWSANQGEASSITFGRFENPSRDWPFTLRLAWTSGPSVTMADIAIGGQETGYEPRATPGKMRAPMIYYGTGFEDYVGDGGLIDSMSPEGTFHYYEDAQCAIAA